MSFVRADVSGQQTVSKDHVSHVARTHKPHAQQVDMFSDYASMTSSSLSRSSSAAGDMAAAGSMSPTSPRRMADAGHVAPAHSDNVAQRPFSPVAAQQPQPVPLPVLVPARQLSTLSTNLSGSLQSTVESLHAIVETLPGSAQNRVLHDRVGKTGVVTWSCIHGCAGRPFCPHCVDTLPRACLLIRRLVGVMPLCYP